MFISEFSIRTGVSARSLRHYEDCGLLSSQRDSNGYRRYSPEDEIRVLQIKTMIAAGLPTHTISEYLDCLRFDGTRVTVHMCPNLRAELDAIMVKLQRQRQEIHGQLQQLAALTAPPQASDSI